MSFDLRCLVVIPSGTRADAALGIRVDFDALHETTLAPAVAAAGMVGARVATGGAEAMERALVDRLLLADCVLADAVWASRSLLVVLGMRAAVRPGTTVWLGPPGVAAELDPTGITTLTYRTVGDGTLDLDAARALREAVTGRLSALAQPRAIPSRWTLPDLLDPRSPSEIARLRTDVFRERAVYSADVRDELALARRVGDRDRLERVRARLGDLERAEAGAIVDLLLSYRAVGDWEGMLRLHAAMPADLSRTTLVAEQFAFALNRTGERERALEVLREVEARRGPSSETSGLMGRVLKDLWADAREHGDAAAASVHLQAAIDCYARGFETDWRDAYPGINAVTLLDIQGGAAARARRDELLPLVRYAATRRLAAGTPDYWDYATLLEVALLEGDAVALRAMLARAIAVLREPWEARTTLRTLELVRRARRARGEPTEGLDEAMAALERAAGPASSG
jgi:hypothetical protein